MKYKLNQTEEYCAEHNCIIIDDGCRYCDNETELREIEDLLRISEIKDRNLKRREEWKKRLQEHQKGSDEN